jgi:hypothetical protein
VKNQKKKKNSNEKQTTKIQRDTRKVLEVIDMFITLIEVVILQVYTNVQAYQIICFKQIQVLYIN